MNREIGLSQAAFGFGAGIFFLGYFIFEIPSNLILRRVGARRWIARIMISWGVTASAMMFVRGAIELPRAAFHARPCRGGILSRHHLLPHVLVPAARARPRDRLVHDRDRIGGSHRGPAVRRAVDASWAGRTFRMAMDVPARGNSRDRDGNRGVALPARPSGRGAVADG